MRNVCFTMAVFAFTSCLAQQNFTVDIWPMVHLIQMKFLEKFRKKQSQDVYILLKKLRCMYFFLQIILQEEWLLFVPADHTISYL